MKEKNSILNKFLQGKISEAEMSFLIHWLDNFRHPSAHELSDEEINNSLKKFEMRLPYTLDKLRHRFEYIAAAALLIGIFSFSYYLLIYQNHDNTASLAAITPAQGKATLILSNGEELAVGSNLQDTILSDYGVEVLQDKQHGLTIAQNGQLPINELRYHTLKTPYGGIVRLKLEDGTIVDLNAGSTIRFPNSFQSHNTRDIYLDGEAFLAVVRDEKRPFMVHSSLQTVEVLGTEFSINTQQSNVTKTTLLKGSVRVHSSLETNKKLILKPGEQAQVNSKGLQKQTINLDKELDWKNNDFYFENTPIHEVMDKIAHWYNVEISVNNTRAGVHFTGIISRKRSLKEVLDFLSQTEKMTYTLKERRLYVD